MGIDAWVKDPIVRLAAERSDGTTLSTLSTLSGLLNEMEERFPGVPFGTILSRSEGRPENLRNRLERCGVTAEDIETVCGPNYQRTDREERREYIWSLADSGATNKAMAEQGVDALARNTARSIQQPLTEKEIKALHLVDMGVSRRKIQKDHGIFSYTTSIAIEKRNYHAARGLYS